MHRSVSETRRSVATRPKRSPSERGTDQSRWRALGRRSGALAPRIASAGAVPALPAQPAVGRVLLVVVVLGYATWWLGGGSSTAWRTASTTTPWSSATRAPPRWRSGEVLAPGRDGRPRRRVADGHRDGSYLADETVIVRYRTRDGSSGVDVVVPLQTDGGPALLVDRGWLATDNSGATPDAVPAPPQARSPSPATCARTRPATPRRSTDRSTRSISSEQIGPAIGREVYGGFVDLATEDPAPADAAGEGRAARPGQRPALLLRAPVVVLRAAGRLRLPLPRLRRVARRAARRGTGRQNVRSMPPSTGSITPVTNDAAGESRKAAARPNSSGSP